MDICGVDDAVRRGRTAAQAVEVVQGAAMNLGPGVRDQCGALIGASQPDDLVSGVDELSDDGGSDESARAGHEYAHDDCLHWSMSVADITLSHDGSH